MPASCASNEIYRYAAKIKYNSWVFLEENNNWKCLSGDNASYHLVYKSTRAIRKWYVISATVVACEKWFRLAGHLIKSYIGYICISSKWQGLLDQYLKFDHSNIGTQEVLPIHLTSRKICKGNSYLAFILSLWSFYVIQTPFGKKIFFSK